VCQEAEEEGEGVPPARCVCMPGIKLITPEGKAKIIIRDFSVKFLNKMFAGVEFFNGIFTRGFWT
jgi:hypothetical protein